MADYLMRDDAPLSSHEWGKLDEVVEAVARRVLVGRRFVPLAGPFGIGTQVLPLDEIERSEACMHGAEPCEDEAISVTSRSYIPVPMIHKDFMLNWRDVESARQTGHGLELAPAAAAAASVARAEDQMVIADGLLKSAGQRLALSDWSESGNPINDVSAASAALAQAGVFGPYTLVLSTALFAMLQRPFRHSGQLESKLVQAIADGGIFQSPAITGNQALLVAQGAQYMDLAVAQDLTTAYLGPEGMDHRFRVLESLVLRVKQPAAVCVIE